MLCYLLVKLCKFTENFFQKMLFWVEIVVILWICLVLLKIHTTVIIVSAWLSTQIWVKWVSQFDRKSDPNPVKQSYSISIQFWFKAIEAGIILLIDQLADVPFFKCEIFRFIIFCSATSNLIRDLFSKQMKALFMSKLNKVIHVSIALVWLTHCFCLFSWCNSF